MQHVCDQSTVQRQTVTGAVAIAATKNAIKLGAKIESLGKALRPSARNSVWGSDVHELYLRNDDGTKMNVITGEVIESAVEQLVA